MRKINQLHLSQKIMLIFFSAIIFTVIFAYFFINYLYSELYISSVEESIVYQGKRTAAHYHYGELSDEIIQKIQWYNIVSEYDIIVVDNLEELTSYFPYQIDYENLIDADMEEELARGNYVLKKGFVKELNQDVLGAIFPIKSDEGLIGFIYIYVPLVDVQEVFKGSIPILLIVGSVFFALLFFIVHKIGQSLFRPLQKLQDAAEDLAAGDYSHDISLERSDEIGQLADTFNHMRASLQANEERQKEFTSNIMHELRTPLTYIGGYTQALKQEKQTDKSEAYLATIESETERLTKIINDLADLNHMKEELYTLDIQPIAAAQLLYDTIQLFQIHIAEKKLRLKTTIDENIILFADEQRIEQIFYNTIDNAVKYAPKNSQIEVALFEENQRIHYKLKNITDTLKYDDLNRIDERFYRTDKARNRKTGGTGLGLAIVKEIVRIHQGKVNFSVDDSNIFTLEIQLKNLKESM